MIRAIEFIATVLVMAAFLFGLPWLVALVCVASGGGPGVCGL